MQTLSPKDEARLLEGVKQAVDLVDREGLSPNAALTKVAQEHRFSRGELRAAVHAYNNGRQLAQWQANDNVLDKLASFSLADYDVVHDQIWGGKAEAEKTAQALPLEFRQPPTWLRNPDREQLRALDVRSGQEKAAADAELPEREHVLAHQRTKAAQAAWNAHQKTKRAYDEAHRQFSAAHDDLQLRLRLLENYFQKAAVDRLPFAVVDDVICAYHGRAGRSLMDLMARSFPKEVRAADTRLHYERPPQRHGPPFTYAEAAIAAATRIGQTKQALDQAYQALEKTAEDLRPFVETPRPATSPSEPLSLCLIKDAGWADWPRSMMMEALKAPPNEVASDLQDLEDPDHENKLRAIRAQAMLANIMTDPNNPVSGYDPEQVFQAYNEIAQVVPRGADRAAIVQPLLAKRLSAHPEPFEAKEMVDIEKGLSESAIRPNTMRLINHAPSSLLG